MRTRWGWYMTWADDPFESKWYGYCPVWIASMRAGAKFTGRTLIERRVKFLTTKRTFCPECQIKH